MKKLLLVFMLLSFLACQESMINVIRSNKYNVEQKTWRIYFEMMYFNAFRKKSKNKFRISLFLAYFNKKEVIEIFITNFLVRPNLLSEYSDNGLDIFRFNQKEKILFQKNLFSALKGEYKLRTKLRILKIIDHIVSPKDIFINLIEHLKKWGRGGSDFDDQELRFEIAMVMAKSGPDILPLIKDYIDDYPDEVYLINAFSFIISEMAKINDKKHVDEYKKILNPLLHSDNDFIWEGASKSLHKIEIYFREKDNKEK